MAGSACCCPTSASVGTAMWIYSVLRASNDRALQPAGYDRAIILEMLTTGANLFTVKAMARFGLVSGAVRLVQIIWPATAAIPGCRVYCDASPNQMNTHE